jgi:hypothetical protein
MTQGFALIEKNEKLVSSIIRVSKEMLSLFMLDTGLKVLLLLKIN